MIKIKPLNKLKKNIIEVPGCKYIANRVLILSALAEGKSIISNVPDNNDIRNTIRVLKELGIDIHKCENQVNVQGSEGVIKFKTNTIDVGESGTLMRFITAVSALSNQTIKITGSKRICERPIEDLLDALKQVGVKAESSGGYLPIIIEGGTIKGGEIYIKGNVSSQFISALLLVSPYVQGDLKIKLTSELVSATYVDLTIDLMHKFGVKVERNGYDEFIIKAGQKYIARDYIIPGDWSSASYFLAVAALLKDKITILNMDLNSIQGESKFYKVLEQLGCEIELGENSITVSNTNKLNAINIDMGNMPDVVQTLCAIAPYCKGTTVIRNISQLKYKECNRIEETSKELKKLSCDITTTQNSIVINSSILKGAMLETHNDHRMAMSLAVTAMKTEGIIINDPEVSHKSFPGFWDKLKEIGVEFEEV